MTDTSATFPVPFAAPERQSWRSIASSLGSNALAGFPANAFEELAVARSFVGRRQIILSDPAGIRHVLIENPDNYRRTAATERLLGPVVGDGMLLATGEDWRAQRRAAAPGLRAAHDVGRGRPCGPRRRPAGRGPGDPGRRRRRSVRPAAAAGAGGRRGGAVLLRHRR